MNHRLPQQPADRASASQQEGQSRLLAAYREGRLSRRQLLVRAAAFGASATAINAFLIACGAGNPTATTGSGAATTSAPTTGAAGGVTTTSAAGTTAAGAATTVPAATSAAAAPSPAAAGGTTYGFRPGTGSRIDQVTLSSPVEVTFWHTQVRANEEKLKKIIGDFEAKNPNIKIKAEYQGSYDDLYKKTIAAISGGGLPDLSVAYENQVSEYQVENVVAPLEDYINSQKYGLTVQDLQDFYPLYITSNQYPEFKGQMLSFPFTKSVLSMYYNADKLREQNIPVPQTWADFSNAVKKFTGDPKGYAIAVDASTFNGAVYSRGGQLINEAQTQWLFNGQPGVEFLQMQQDLVRSGGAYLIDKRFADQEAFGQGKVVFTMGSSSGFPFYKEVVDKGAKFNWNVAIIPHGDNDKPATTSYGANIAMFNKGAAEKQLAAWQFIKYFTSTDVNAEWSVASGYLPIRKSAAETEIVRKQFDTLPAYKTAVTEIQQYARPETTVRGTQDTRMLIQNAWTEAVTNLNSNPKQLLDEAVRKGNDALKQSR